MDWQQQEPAQVLPLYVRIQAMDLREGKEVPGGGQCLAETKPKPATQRTQQNTPLDPGAGALEDTAEPAAPAPACRPGAKRGRDGR
ncbi:hypothetical protein CPLU01_12431 [Colletotrichum plurivorum]|uniref:Uncharacterized protein n=1 Tax=Colletotrichum plurivorum TaxID=2175906 RepID=A0A8H6N689_9PEZI|nr:hypothetical protein CPLU01_12431 [Colletotrichum plurivorum]